MDSTFYEEFYSKMTKDIFLSMVKATPQNLVPERITYNRKKLEINK